VWRPEHKNPAQLLDNPRHCAAEWRPELHNPAGINKNPRHTAAQWRGKIKNPAQFFDNPAPKHHPAAPQSRDAGPIKRMDVQDAHRRGAEGAEKSRNGQHEGTKRTKGGAHP
jgi:hypothetical protein